MRFETVNAYAFGALKSAKLTLAPGLNVVWGPNEAGKSTWHAAMYAGLCGMARGKGAPRKDDQDFRDRHAPWDGEAWEVGATIRLRDNRRIALRHDLAGRIECAAVDADLGTDCSSEIIHDASPDGSRWLGLDRRSFLATACVRQADLLGVLDEPGMLQQYLEKAAASAGVDATATQALERLKKFHTENVGSDRRNAVGPLGVATRALEVAETELNAARSGHRRYELLTERLAQHEAAVTAVEARLKRAQLMEARRELGEVEARLEAGRTLEERFANGPPAVDVEALRRANEIENLLHQWLRPGAPATMPAPVWSGPGVILGTLAVVAGLVGIGMGAGMLAMLLSVAGIGLIVWSLWRNAIRPKDESGDDIRGFIEGAARELGISWTSGDSLVEGLRSWIDEVRAAVSLHNAQVGEYQELASRRGTASVDELAAKARDKRSTLHALESELDHQRDETPADDRSTAELQQELMAARSHLDRLRGEQSALTSSLPGVADAEERLAATQHDLARVERLDRVLDLTSQFLARAQERVHHDIAPLLAESVRGRLGAVTRGRYADVAVDPASLGVKVQDRAGHWRDATRLSHGTAEQIYLLLRVALAERLTTPGEVCPLILDEVTAHCDDQRAEAVLEALHQISGERQVILFSQESRVRQWAEAHLSSEQDRLEVLAAPAGDSGGAAGVRSLAEDSSSPSI